MKVAVVIDTWFPAIGGGQINAWEISKRLVKKGLNIDIITRNNGKYTTPKIKNLGAYQIGKKSEATDNISRILFLIRSFFILSKGDYDLIHLQAFFPGFLAPFIKIILKKPVIFTVHGTRMFEKNLGNSLGFILEKILLTRIKYDAQISVTKAFLKFKNVNQNKVYIPNGIDISKFEKVKVKKANYPKILWVGRFDPVKRVDILLQAMKIIEKKLTEARLTLVGYGQEENKLKEIVKRLNLRNIDFVGMKEGEDLIREYKSSHVFVLTSVSEGQPISILEAIAARIPIVASNIGGIPELISNKIGILVPFGDSRILAEAIVSALARKDFSFTQSYQNLKRHHSWDMIAHKTLAAYNNLFNET